MKRRNFLQLLSTGLAGAPLAVSAAQTAPLLGATMKAPLGPMVDVCICKDGPYLHMQSILKGTNDYVNRVLSIRTMDEQRGMEWIASQVCEDETPVPFAKMDLSLLYPFGQPVFWIRTVALPGKEQA